MLPNKAIHHLQLWWQTYILRNVCHMYTHAVAWSGTSYSNRLSGQYRTKVHAASLRHHLKAPAPAYGLFLFGQPHMLTGTYIDVIHCPHEPGWRMGVVLLLPLSVHVCSVWCSCACAKATKDVGSNAEFQLLEDVAR